MDSALPNLSDIEFSILRWLLGVGVGCCIGLLLGLACWCKWLDRALAVMGGGARAIPIIGLVPVIQYFWGVSEYGKIGLIAWSIAFPVWVSVHSAALRQDQDAELVWIAHNIGASSMLRHYTLPRIMVGFVQGIDIAIGLGWLAVVASELVGTYTSGFWGGGIGHKLFFAFSAGDWRAGLICLGLFGVCGVLSTLAWRVLGVKTITWLTGISPRTQLS